MGMAVLQAGSVCPDLSGAADTKLLKFLRHTAQYWDKIPQYVTMP
jgi:hypothetical protein